MDIRHRHSSPLSTERLALVCPFLKKINIPVRETSRVITADVRGGHWGGFSCSSGAIHKNGVPFISGRKENRTETSKKKKLTAEVTGLTWWCSVTSGRNSGWLKLTNTEPQMTTVIPKLVEWISIRTLVTDWLTVHSAHVWTAASVQTNLDKCSGRSLLPWVITPVILVLNWSSGNALLPLEDSLFSPGGKVCVCVCVCLEC